MFKRSGNILKRKIHENLLAWKKSPVRKPLIVKGRRRCGKTFSVLQFAEENNEHAAYLNFLQNANDSAIISDSLDVARLATAPRRKGSRLGGVGQCIISRLW